ncbi:hypothetical protein LTR91_023828 [Friedmanniomyces endolithicus]|uniref:Uncharacterized protein n=2 Tax=Dothideomycetidae TaxID=451867 RepID=A0AAN6K133_9PEZI|nr:hypothetical protein LTR75_017860 [Friedmanniomyces endolithicus]KAK5140670.1 hypothetical protein LTR32_006592 [Rachicladosporium monterosium]KAK0892865.1 hypothetical protein LTR57_024222 [Friedmanniomyces endolithicus]KAK0950641.1 hypothetical protein LTS01_025530 [Friedmanniomyces endolithicus]KAK0953457.1 hypothetical protein LTR91_023828 [Friedmanniomyces endolithicus]
MILVDGIGEDVAEDARKSLATQVERWRAIVTEPPAAKTQAAKPFTILDDTTETSVAGEEFIKPLADLLGISEDEVRRRLKRGKCVCFLPIADGVIDYIHTAPGRIVDTLAFSALRDCPVMRDGDAEHSDVKPGQVMYYDGDEPIKWQGKEEGFGLMMWCSKTTSFKAG